MGMGNGEWGMGKGEFGIRNSEFGIRKKGMGKTGLRAIVSIHCGGSKAQGLRQI